MCVFKFRPCPIVQGREIKTSLFAVPVHVSVCCACAKNVQGHLAVVWCCLAVALWCAGGVLLGCSAGAVVLLRSGALVLCKGALAQSGVVMVWCSGACGVQKWSGTSVFCCCSCALVWWCCNAVLVLGGVGACGGVLWVGALSLHVKSASALQCEKWARRIGKMNGIHR